MSVMAMIVLIFLDLCKNEKFIKRTCKDSVHRCNGVIDCCNGSDEEDLKDNPSYLAASLAAKSLQKSF